MIRGMPTQPPRGRAVRISGVDWPTYSRLLRALAEQPGVKLIYDRGELEIMSPTFDHDSDGRVLGHFIVILAEELGLPLKCGGSTTLRRRRLKRGLEADECYWIASSSRIAGRKIDLRTDPPPDLAIEIDVTRSSLDRLAIYAALRVPEVWRVRRQAVEFRLLQPDGTYALAANSQSFPLLTADDVARFLEIARSSTNDVDAFRQFRAWVRERVAGGPSPS